jgi:hypothetical protein
MPRICTTRLAHSRIIVLRSRSRSACHVAEPFDDGLDAMPELRVGQVLLHQFRLGLLAFASEPRGRRPDSPKAMHGVGAPRSVTQTPSIGSKVCKPSGSAYDTAKALSALAAR